jgi:16S rRNA (cytosine967-C5)-methyltransferase
MAEQDSVLTDGARFVKAGGRMIYVTCSFLLEENEDRLSAFLGAHPDFRQSNALGEIENSGLLSAAGRAALEPCATSAGALRMTPARTGTDGFFVAVLRRS